MDQESKDENPAEEEVDQVEPAQAGTSRAENQRILRSYDRLVPRYCDQDSKKRKHAEDLERSAKRLQSSGAKKEYSKLKTLVPALSEREDLSKVEIIEETIRYIDALHHQLAQRNLEPSSAESSESAAPTETAPENSSSPLKTLPSSAEARPPRTISQPPQNERIGDVKAAVENIQAMFAAYLENQRSSSSSDESTS